MKKIIASSVLLLILIISIFPANGSNNIIGINSKTDKESAYKTGLLVLKVKPEFRSKCSANGINLAKLNDALNRISASKISRKFPHSRVPELATDNKGHKLVDLTLIYEVEFSPVVRIEEALSLIKATGLVEYAEPLYLQQLDFIPNDANNVTQYALGKINAYNAWDVWTGDTNVVIGIVDSGTDWDHPDLQGNIKYNYADPIDGLDNDNDGFIDNYRGWDVSENDNDPMVVTEYHGSHVSGCADAVTNNGTGVAAPAYNCKFLPVKSSLDPSVLIDNGFEGIVYAADHGASVINCSWGRVGAPSQMEMDAINYATFNRNALVVAAAGNDGIDEVHYPSSYENVISVAATSQTDGKASFSSFNSTVDVCAPGVNIRATYFDNTYANLDGTSMASPIAAGCAAMIKSRFPSLDALQIGEQLRITCDNINAVSGNSPYTGKIGKGRVNLFKAVTDSTSPGVVMKKSFISDNNDEVFIVGDTLRIKCLFENLLRPTTNLVCSLSSTSTYVQIIQPTFNAGVMATHDTLSNYTLPYKVLILPTAPLNSDVTLRVNLTDGTWSDIYTIDLTVNVDYINVNINNIGTSITSKGTIGYNQPGKLQGLGFTYKDSATILYDMGLMIGAMGTQVSDNVRSTIGNDDEDFSPYVTVTSHEPGTISDFDIDGSFKDNGITSSSPLNLLINHHAYAWVAAPDDNYVMVQYIIHNMGTNTLTNMYSGLCADWDVQLFDSNKCSTDNARRMGYVWCTQSAGLYAGIKLLSHTAGFNHYAIDNIAGNSGIIITDNPGGFSNAEKYTALSTSRLDAGTTSTGGNDVLSVVSTGAINLAPGDSLEVAYALIAGEDLASIQASADAAQTKYDNTFVGLLPVDKAGESNLFQSFPNPVDKQARIEFSLKENNLTELNIYNLTGQMIKSVVNEKLNAGKYTMLVDVSELPSGHYFYRIVSGNFTRTLPLNIVH